ncbi:MAG: large conductance mechanosensitive channel protein MscL [Nakamurella sp.]
MLKGFKDFVLRGNVVELAVAFVIAAAFATLVNTFVSAIIKPILSVITPGQTQGFGFYLSSGNAATFIDVGVLLNSVIVFVLTAALIYFLLVVPMNKINERRARRAGTLEAEPADPTETELLTEIRDLLQAQRRV